MYGRRLVCDSILDTSVSMVDTRVSRIPDFTCLKLQNFNHKSELVYLTIDNFIWVFWYFHFRFIFCKVKNRVVFWLIQKPSHPCVPFFTDISSQFLVSSTAYNKSRETWGILFFFMWRVLRKVLWQTGVVLTILTIY